MSLSILLVGQKKTSPQPTHPFCPLESICLHISYWLNIWSVTLIFVVTGIFPLQEELQQVAHLWNTHIIRNSRNAVAPSGHPILMYTVPQLFGGEDHLKEVSQEAVEACKHECQQRGPYSCDETVFSLCFLIMAENFLLPPTTADEAIELYLFLRANILKDL